MAQAQIYDSYWVEGGHHTQEWTSAFFDETLGVLTGKRCVLDYGCGMGYSYQRLLAANVGEYLGTDISNVALLDARKKGYRSLQIQENGTVDLPDASCDGAVCSEVFEHLWDPLAAARELCRVLKPGGVLVATVPNFGYFPNRIRALVGASVPSEPESAENRYRGVHIRFFSAKLFRSLLRDAGFTNVQLYGWCGCNIWDISTCAGPFSRSLNRLTQHMPQFTRMDFLASWFPNVFASRLRIIARR